MPDFLELGLIDRLQRLLGSKLVKVCTAVKPNPTIASITNCYLEIQEKLHVASDATKDEKGKFGVHPDRSGCETSNISRQHPEVSGCTPNSIFQGNNFDVIIALGGGSALDTAKVAALLQAVSKGDNWLSSHLREGQSIPASRSFGIKPIIAIPTTSGTGSEVTMWATVWDEITRAKYSVTHPGCYSQYALLDPELTDTLPYETTLFTALDTLSHSMEAIWNKNGNSVSDALAFQSISISAQILENDFKYNYSQPTIRDNLMTASLLAGLAFSNTKTAIAHSMSYPITSKFGLPHGLACSFTLPEVMRINHRQYPGRIDLIIEALRCDSIDSAVEQMYEMFCKVGLAGIIKGYFTIPIDFSAIKLELINKNRAGNNLTKVSQEEAENILNLALTNIIEYDN